MLPSACTERRTTGKHVVVCGVSPMMKRPVGGASHRCRRVHLQRKYSSSLLHSSLFWATFCRADDPSVWASHVVCSGSSCLLAMEVPEPIIVGLGPTRSRVARERNRGTPCLANRRGSRCISTAPFRQGLKVQGARREAGVHGDTCMRRPSRSECLNHEASHGVAP